jgi:lysophospholipase L1-like esterase
LVLYTERVDSDEKSDGKEVDGGTFHFRMNNMEIDQQEGNAPKRTGQASGEVPPEGKKNDVTMESHKIKDGAIKVLALGDSHLRKGHYFPELYKLAQEEGKVDPRYGSLGRMEAWEEKDSGFAPGFTLNEEYKGQVLDLIGDHYGKATAFILSVGTNDIRERYKKATVEALLERYKAIINKVKETPGVALLIVEPIPCNKVPPGLRNWLDREIWSMCHQDEKLRYVGLSRGREPVLTKVDGKLWQEKFWEDQIHLNKEGVKLLMKAVANGLNQIRSECFFADPEASEPRKAWRRGVVEADSTRGRPKAWQDKKKIGVESGRITKKIGKGEIKGAKAPIRLFTGQRRGSYQRGSRSPVRPQPHQGKGPDYYRERRAEALRRYQAELEEIEKEEQAEKARGSVRNRLGYGVRAPYRKDERGTSRSTGRNDDRGTGGGGRTGEGAGFPQPMPFYPFGVPWIPNPYYRPPQ